MTEKKKVNVVIQENQVDPYAPRPWLDQGELKTLFYMRTEGTPYHLIGMELKRTANACRKKFNSHVWKNEPWYDPMVAKGNDAVKQDLLEKLTRASDRRNEMSKVKMDIVADRIETAVKALPEIHKPFFPNLRKKTHNTPEDVVLLLSDFHIGHEHTLEETGGLSEYNINIFKRRMSNLKFAIRDIFELHAQLYKLPNLHIMVLGDVVAGMVVFADGD